MVTLSSQFATLPKIKIQEVSNIENAVQKTMSEHIHQTGAERPFYVIDLAKVMNKCLQWNALFPTITPFYAVKCNPNIAILKVLAMMNVGFDCASKLEIETILSLGVPPSRILFAHPCKARSALRYAVENDVLYMTFDNSDELYKIHDVCPQARLLIRIETSDGYALNPLSSKFGTSLRDCRKLFQLAKKLGLKIVGVSFHVGSGCFDERAYVHAISDARKVFDIAGKFGYSLEILDIGGGYPGEDDSLNPSAEVRASATQWPSAGSNAQKSQQRIVKNVTIEDVASVVNLQVKKLFPDHVKVISEPGRLFVQSAHHLAASIISRQDVESPVPSPTPVTVSNGGLENGDSRTSDGVERFDCACSGCCFVRRPNQQPSKEYQREKSYNPSTKNTSEQLASSPASSTQANSSLANSSLANSSLANSYLTNSSLVNSSLATSSLATSHLATSPLATSSGASSPHTTSSHEPPTYRRAQNSDCSCPCHRDVESYMHICYFINEGVFGSFKDSILMNENFIPKPLFPDSTETKELKLSSVYGPSGHQLECLSRDVMLPGLDVGDWLQFDGMGAYRMSVASSTEQLNCDVIYLWSSPEYPKPINFPHFLFS